MLFVAHFCVFYQHCNLLWSLIPNIMCSNHCLCHTSALLKANDIVPHTHNVHNQCSTNYRAMAACHMTLGHYLSQLSVDRGIRLGELLFITIYVYFCAILQHVRNHSAASNFKLQRLLLAWLLEFHAA